MAAQTAAPSVQANGSATLTAKPNQAQLDIGVVTIGVTAQEASQKNASLSDTVQAALSKVLGSAGTLQTVSYYVTPRYSTTPNQPSVIIGYTAGNTVRVTTTDLSQIGLLIDAANQAGANSVGGLSFGLQNPEPLVEQALTLATKQAAAHAGAHEWRIEALSFEGDTALVRLGGQFAGVWYTDDLSMLRIDDAWRIVHKTFHPHPST
jgi:uncharacterized protein YggE